MTSTTTHRRGRTVITGVVCVALAGGAADAIAVRKPNATATIATPTIFKTAAVSTGDLTTTERIDGIVELSSTLPVLHRIEGQTSSSTTPVASASATAPQASNAASNPSAQSSALIADCPTTVEPTTIPESTTTEPTDTTPVGTTPVDTTPVDTTPAQTTTTTTVAAPVEPCDTTTTTTVVTPETTLAAGGGGGGGSRTGGGGATGASQSAAAATTGSAASNARVTQTVTSLIGANTAIELGDVLYTVDGAPVVALDGALPAWRTMSTSSTDGADIAQLEASLVALGYDPGLKVTVDNHFDSATRTMVKAWQQGLGVEPTGTVTLGSVVFLPSSTTVNAVNQTVGATVGDGDTVLTLSAATQDVVVDVPAGDEAKVVPGLAVAIGNIEGTVSRLRSADRNGSVVVQAVIAPASAIENATGGSTVKVTLTLQNDAGVLIAPAEALVSRLDGTYAVQAQTSDGTTKWLTVELLGVSGGNIAIRGPGVTEGTVLLLPA
jgi:peptidoglycan hydrolase-like protein with peptidoglycan-binding domain